MTLDTIVVTGGNGTIGSAILEHLNEHGYTTVNLARGSRRETASDRYVRTDLLDAGETYGAIAKADADAIVHAGTIPDPHGNPDVVVYESNVMSSVHVLEAADALGVDAVCLASSINAMGSEHQERPAEVHYLPVDEPHPRTPDDAYGTAKHAMEVTASGYGRRPSTDVQIATLRYPWVVSDDEMREHLVEPDRSLESLDDGHPATGRDVLYAYLEQQRHGRRSKPTSTATSRSGRSRATPPPTSRRTSSSRRHTRPRRSGARWRDTSRSSTARRPKRC